MVSKMFWTILYRPSLKIRNMPTSINQMFGYEGCGDVSYGDDNL